jgi:hypothetical protein
MPFVVEQAKGGEESNKTIRWGEKKPEFKITLGYGVPLIYPYLPVRSMLERRGMQQVSE